MRASRFLVFVLMVFASRSNADWEQPESAPVERLLFNVRAYTGENPQDPEGHFLLGRIHGYAFALGASVVAVESSGNRNQLPELAPRFRQYRRPDDWHRADETLFHLERAINSYRFAISLDGDDARFHLGLAYLLRRGSHLASHLDSAELLGLTAPDPAWTRGARIQLNRIRFKAERDEEGIALALKGLDLESQSWTYLMSSQRASPSRVIHRLAEEAVRHYWLTLALNHYEAAHDRALATDLKGRRQWLARYTELISYEGASSYLELALQLGIEAPRAEVMKQTLEKLERVHTLVITPIVLALHQVAGLGDLTASESRVSFDLDGDGRVEEWPWVRPDTGLLVWDPDGEGQITSGRQLFGNATWWMLFPDGYRAMDALDDDRDGWLRGGELSGLGLWFDRNSNGVSEAGEVRPLAAYGVRGLATRADGHEGLAPMNRCGVEFLDGSVLPSWDWIARSTQP